MRANFRTRLLLLVVIAFGSHAVAGAADERVDFNRDIRPILSDHCFQCHGPDAGQRKAELRFDQRGGLLGKREGRLLVVPKRKHESPLFERITSDDPDERMPPAESKRPLSKSQIELIGRWIDQGAVWQDHWSFVTPRRPPLPAAAADAWVRNPIDAFVLGRMRDQDLTPAAVADRATLARRLTLDLTGLPPTSQQLDRFLNDRRPDAYEQLVDRLLASPRYGERMALPWLDAARYADTSGYQTDGVRHMWRWRDWVIQALNGNQPFDEFTIEQLAGDLLPRPTLDQLIATGFNRNHRSNSEGGIVSEEYLNEYAVDRVDTTFTVWMGLTIGCARCHDHKYDPLTQVEFYQALSYFNNLPERGRVIKYGNSAPLIKTPTRLQAVGLAQLDRRLQATQTQLRAQMPAATKAMHAWVKQLPATPLLDRLEREDLAFQLPLDGPSPVIDNVTSKDGEAENDADKVVEEEVKKDADKDPGNAEADNAKTNNAETKSDGATNAEPAADARPSLTITNAVYVADHRSSDENGATQQHQRRALKLDGSGPVLVGKPVEFDGSKRFSLGFWVRPESDGCLLNWMDDDDSRDKGFSIELQEGRLDVRFGPRWLDDAIKLRTRKPLKRQRWHHVMLTYDGSQLARGLQVYLNGRRQQVDVELDMFTGTFPVAYSLRIGGREGQPSLHGAVDDVVFYLNRTLTGREVAIEACADSIQQIAARRPADWTASQRAKVQQLYLGRYADEPVRSNHRRLGRLVRERQALIDGIPTTMVMRERKTVQPTFVLKRGQYDQPGEPVTRGVPASLPPLVRDAPKNRLGLARWLVDPQHPLTARVAVNRIWQVHFGTGLVRTMEDFGSQGERPTHPELLDWLAREFVESGWNVKRLRRLIVTSATYRQGPQGTAESRKLDPQNRFYSRAARLRLPAETIRDQALAVGGLLVGPLGGPSVKPYQPAGLWKEIASDSYQPDTGQSLYRRSLYTFWKRTVPPPAMVAFDGGSRETCVLRRSRTNTPLQALTLLNERSFVEAARGLGQRMMSRPGSTRERLVWGFRVVTSRRASDAELAVLTRGWQRYRDRYATSKDEARKLLALGDLASDPRLDPVELAAYTLVANILINLDETIVRP